MSRGPLWGNFIHFADQDMLAFGLLARGQLFPLAFYHGTQAIEKYLKALCLSIIDPNGSTETALTQSWIRQHNLERLATRCSERYPYYAQDQVLANLRRFAEFDQRSRYPWVNQVHGNGFTSEDIPIVGELCCRLRNDLPIVKDDYILGMEVRGHFHDDQKTPDPARPHWSHEAVQALRQVLPNLSDFVRW